MVKTVCDLGAKLTEARKTIEDLKSKAKALTLENELLGAPSVPYGQTTKASVDRKMKTSKAKTSKTETCKPKLAVRHPTVETRTFESKRDLLTRDLLSRKYKYINGKPVQIVRLPRYMRPTASYKAKSAGVVSSDYNELLIERHFSQSSVNEEETVTDLPRTDKSLNNIEKPCLLSGSEIYTLADDDRIWHLFPVFKFYISSKDGWNLLSTAYEMAKEAFHEAARKFWPRIWENIKDGPHLVNFGRAELISLVGKFGSTHDLSLCGTESSTVHWYLMEMACIRNQICHPDIWALRNAVLIHGYLTAILRLTLALGDGDRSVQVRLLRDKLRKLVVDFFDLVNSLSPLASLPFAAEVQPHWEPHHLVMFRDIFHEWEDRWPEEKEKLKGMRQAAEVWKIASL